MKPSIYSAMEITMLFIMATLPICSPSIDQIDYVAYHLNDSYQLYKEYFKLGKSIAVISFLDKESAESHLIIQDFIKNTDKPIYVFKLDEKEASSRSVTLSETYMWNGRKYPSTSNMTRRKVLSSAKPIVRISYNFFFVVENEVKLLKYIDGLSPRFPFRETRSRFVIVVLSKTSPIWREIIENILFIFWKQYGILNIIINTNFSKENEIFIFNPFERPTRRSRNFGGAVKYDIKEFHIEEMTYKHFNGYPIRVCMFNRMPTAVTEIPQVLRTRVRKEIKRSSGYAGLDGMVLANLATVLNFTTHISPGTDGIEYGFAYPNGTFTGSLGDVMYHKVDISFNARFIKFYDTYEIDFTSPVYFDAFCVIVPKSQRIPQWMMLFQCFSPMTWTAILVFSIFNGLFWYFMKEWYHRCPNRSKEDYHISWYIINLELILITTSNPSTRLPTRTAERLFVASCLCFGVIVVGIFQGSLATAFSTTSFYPDIDTLQALDTSGLIIGTTSRGLDDTFGTRDSPLLESLRSKIHILTTPAIDRAAYYRDVACVERKSDVNLIIKTRYESRDGTAMLHVVRECPRSYYLAYVVKKGWALLPSINKVINRMFEAGLLNHWYEETVDAFITQTRLHSNIKVDSAEPLGLVDMQTSFYVLIIGLVVSCVVFTIEMCMKKKCRY